jgi:DNA-binding response OmpR family regulator
MVVDDSAAVRAVVTISLERVGIPAAAFPGGFEALQALQSGKVAPPRVLLLDIGMPRMNGYELAKLLKSNAACAETQIVMLSGHDGVVNRTLARLSGATDFIAKPFKSGELVRRIRRALGSIDPDSGWPS